MFIQAVAGACSPLQVCAAWCTTVRDGLLDLLLTECYTLLLIPTAAATAGCHVLRATPSLPACCMN
jgi:hypothetical protein